MQSRIVPPSNPQPGSATWIAPGILYCHSPQTHTETAIRAYVDAMRAAVAKHKGRYVLISDTRHLRTMPDAVARRLYAQLGAEVHRRDPEHLVHSVTIIEGTVMRAALTAVMWILGDSASSHAVAGSFEEALRNAQSKL